MFDKTKPEYEKALKDSGYDSVELNYNQNKQRESRRNRNRNIIWFNPRSVELFPLMSQNVSLKVH